MILFRTRRNPINIIFPAKWAVLFLRSLKTASQGAASTASLRTKNLHSRDTCGAIRNRNIKTKIEYHDVDQNDRQNERPQQHSSSEEKKEGSENLPDSRENSVGCR